MSILPEAVLVVVAVWWLGTGIVLRLQQRLIPTNLSTSVGIIFIACLGFGVLLLTRQNLSWISIISGFISAVVVWGCIELSYYLGRIAGTHQSICPPSITTWARFKLALGTSIWHELLVTGLGLLLILLFYKASNTVGLYTYMVLWLMRWSAKLNLFLGVPNFNTSWIPARLAYISSYIRTGTITPFFFISILSASFVVFQLLSKSTQVGIEQPLIYIIPAILLILAIVEHVFMLLPFQEVKMWNRVFNSKT